MKIDLVEFIDDGAFADVWKATDELGRTFAVKIIREATINVSNALEHARALARANHQNVRCNFRATPYNEQSLQTPTRTQFMCWTIYFSGTENSTSVGRHSIVSHFVQRK